MYKIKKYFQGVIKQGKMVRWPTGKELMGYFAVVMCVIIFSAVACSIDDYIIAQILGALDRNLVTSSSSSSTSAEFKMVLDYISGMIGVIYGK
ncbi:MAG: preprotein translocase subunit SecE [Bacilli bacterium]|jgi:preprotein translocase, secE subunit